MRLVLFFDLPMVTKVEVRTYSRFRKWLIKNGYIMMQFSVYSKVFSNRDAVENHIVQLKKNVPNKGQIRIMKVTEKQYSNIEVIVGKVSVQEIITNTESVLVL